MSLFWLDRPDHSIAVLSRAFTAHVAAGDHAGAAMAAWQLFYDHALVGEVALADTTNTSMPPAQHSKQSALPHPSTTPVSSPPVEPFRECDDKLGRYRRAGLTVRITTAAWRCAGLLSVTWV